MVGTTLILDEAVPAGFVDLGGAFGRAVVVGAAVPGERFELGVDDLAAAELGVARPGRLGGAEGVRSDTEADAAIGDSAVGPGPASGPEPRVAMIA